MTIHYHCTGEERKALVNAISEIVGQPAEYLGAPSFAYKIGDYKVDKEGELSNPHDLYCREFMALVNALEAKGFVAKHEPEVNTCWINIPDDGITDEIFDRLLRIIASKSTLLKKALGTESLEVGREDGKLVFPWFPAANNIGEGDAYMRLVCAMVKMAKEQTRVTATEKPIENEKYAMRLFLIRLGFIGDEYKSARKILLKNLSGNSSWKSGKRPEVVASPESDAVPPIPDTPTDNDPEEPWTEEGGEPNEQ